MITAEKIYEDAWGTVDRTAKCGTDLRAYRTEFYNAVSDYCTTYETKISKPKIPVSVCAKIVLKAREIILVDFRNNITPSQVYDERYCVPALYVESGDKKGTYTTSRSAFRELLTQMIIDVKESDFKIFLNAICMYAPVRRRTGVAEDEKNLIPMNNGIFDRKTKTLLPFSPDYVFLWKSPVDMNLAAQSPVFVDAETGYEFEFHKWLSELFEDPADRIFIRQVIASVLLPYVTQDKMVVFFNLGGSAGKGVLLQIIRNLIPDSYLDLDLDGINGDYVLAPLKSGAIAILSDENDVGAFNKSSSKLKALITGDGLVINEKYQPIVNFQFKGTIIQCLNDLKQFADSTKSFYRRFAFLPFKKRFYDESEDGGTEGKPKKVMSIKSDFIFRKEFLEYVVKSCLVDLDYFEEYTETATMRETKAAFIENNSSLGEFFETWVEPIECFRVPVHYLYIDYKVYHSMYGGSATKLLSSKGFKKELEKYVESKAGWRYLKKAALTQRGIDMVKGHVFGGGSDSSGTVTIPDDPNRTYNGVLERLPISDTEREGDEIA